MFVLPKEEIPIFNSTNSDYSGTSINCIKFIYEFEMNLLFIAIVI